MTGQDTASRSVPRGRLTVEDLRTAVADGRVQTVLLAVVDAQGRAKGKAYDARFFLDRLVDGDASGEMCAYIFATDVEMTPLPGFELTGWQAGYGDVRLAPDLGSVRLLPWLPRTAVVFANAIGADEQLVPVAPASILRRQIEALAGLGLTVKAGLETEFVLYQGTLAQAAATGFRGLRPVTADNRDYALDHPRELVRYSAKLTAALAGAGHPVEAVKTEGAPGQVEVTFPYGEPVAACEQHVLLKHAARAVGERMRLLPTFMAAPADRVASGLHLHVSFWRGEEAVLAERERPGELSELGRQVVAGLLEGLPELGPLYAPNVNSYKRYRPHSFTPTWFTWGWDNRSCAVRVVGHGSGLHLEIRLPGADANPYLALAATLAAARCGIEGGLKPPAATTGDGYRDHADAAVPTSLREALRLFEASTLAGDLLGPEVVAHYANLAQAELRVHDARVTDVELARGFAQT
ncbi:glutamine synthetase family protein [Kitasatospora sp. NPDC052896]|uniref:glutamine synthetase family protein n=1 Tax=Kitasatospora sp. NPDC052896 TaxID=3364061 RepID=UPI0037C6E27D